MEDGQYRIPPEDLRWRCDPERYKFGCTDELTPLQEFIGQDRAIRAISFGLGMDKKGYNIFVTGLTGTGKASAIKTHLERMVASKKDLEDNVKDWCYIHNFKDGDRPNFLVLPKGKGKAFRDSLEGLLQNLKSYVVKVFSGEEYDKQRRVVTDQRVARRKELLAQLEEEVNKQGFTIQPSPLGLQLIPVLDGKPLSQKDYMAIKEKQRKAMDDKQQELTGLITEKLEHVQALEKEIGEELENLDLKIGQFAISKPFSDVEEQYKNFPEILQYLRQLKDYTLKRIDLFRNSGAKPSAPEGLIIPGTPRERDPYLPFRVNVFVDNSETVGPPITIEPNPTYGNLFGKIERRPVLGAYTTDHTMLKPGAINIANGGYLVVDIRELLMNPGAWEGLKRVIKTNETRLEDPFEQFGFLAPQGLKPEPIPTDLKVIVTGDHRLYQLLALYDEDFWELFKVQADFDYQIERTEEHLEAYAAFICGCCQTEDILTFERGAVAKIAEYGARLVSKQDKLSSRFGLIKDVVVESSYWAEQDGSATVRADHVNQAIEEKIYRSNLIDEKIRDLITEGTLMVDLEGAVIGQVNGLAVYDLGVISFGKPSRITAKTFLGQDGVINIEREAQLSGRTHDKGVLILSGYLGSKYAKDKPLSLNASLAFEQSYEGVDGDSASSTELYAILSSLSNLPIQQGIAVTGSVNQQGQIQAIGGVNEKIEGFFEVCKAKGLTGEQGVIIPCQNVKNLMLKEEVVKAAEEGKFHVYAIKTIDEGIELLTGVPAGEPGEDDTYPEGTVNYLVDKRLREQAETMKSYYGQNS
jgi:predicted ATP-dependent protease